MSALVRWLPKLAVATADDIARFGPQAARVRTLLDFLPTMSYDALRVGSGASRAADDAGRAGWDFASNAAWNDERYDAFAAASKEAAGAARHGGKSEDLYAAVDAAMGEVVSDLITPKQYHSLTNPLVIGSVVDGLAPRYKNTQFRELLQELAPKNLITQPSDVLGVGRIASLPDEVAIREAIDLVANYGMTFEEALNVIRMV